MSALGLLLLSAVLIVFGDADATMRGAELLAVVTPIAEDMAIVTEISHASPCVGQQFNVIYWLRARRSPAAIDIDPQQFPSFWSEVVPVPPESQSRSRMSQGQVEFLLRQVIAFPLVHGDLELPLISLKIKRARGIASRGAEWDVRGTSKPVWLKIRAVPGRGPQQDTVPLVGDVKGSMILGGAESEFHATLELEGTANLALLQPAIRLADAPDVLLSTSLIDAERLARTVDTAGSRVLQLLMRYRWGIRVAARRRERAPRLEDLMLPVYDPDNARWREIRIPGIQFGSAQAPPHARND